MSSLSSKALRWGFYHMSHQHSQAALYSSISDSWGLFPHYNNTRQLNEITGEATLLSTQKAVSWLYFFLFCIFALIDRKYTFDQNSLFRHQAQAGQKALGFQ